MRGAVIALAALLVSFWLAVSPAAYAVSDFGPYEGYTTGGAVFGMDAGDFNGDHVRDLVVANDPATNQGHISLLYGRKSGQFNKNHIVTIKDSREPEGIAVGKFNSDRYFDFAAADYGGNDVSIFLGNGRSAKFARQLAGTNQPWTIAVGDLNGDRKKDIVTGNYNSTGVSAVSVFFGKGNGKFRDRLDLNAASGSCGIAVGDMNGDGRPDIVTYGCNGTVSVLLNNGDGTFQSSIDKTATTGSGYQIALGDFNGDRNLDVAVPDHTHSVAVVLLGDGHGNLGTPQTYGSPGADGIATADFNADGKLDLAVGFGDPSSTCAVVILHGVGDGSFSGVGCLAPDTGDGGSATQFVLAKPLDTPDHVADVAAGEAAGTNVGINVWLDPCRGSGC